MNFQSNSISTIQDINNNQLSAIKAMPIKNLTSDNDSTFSMYRKTYVETYNATTNSLSNSLPNTVPFYDQRTQRTGLQTTSVATKKWYGNRDASQVTTNRRNYQVGAGSLNANGETMSFNSNIEKNTVNDALRRVRGGGAVAPKKKNFSNSATYVPTPAYAPVETKSITKPIFGIKSPYIYH
jgi:hypothetical protein